MQALYEIIFQTIQLYHHTISNLIKPAHDEPFSILSDKTQTIRLPQC